MHELSMAMNILDIAADEAARLGAARVVAIHLRLGRLSGIVSEALVSAYELARENSSLPEARLVVEEVPIVLLCEECNEESSAESLQNFACRRCGAPSTSVLRGRELEITALEIES